MTSSLFDDIANAPDDLPDIMAGASMEDDVPQTAKRTRRTRAARIVRDDGTEEEAPRITTRVPRNAKLKDDLMETYVSLASELAVVAPTMSGVLILRAERTMDGLVALASGHKRTMAALRKVANAGKGVDLLQTLVLVIAAAAVDFGRIPIDHPFLDHFGHVEIRRDEKGNAVRDSTGKMVKDKKSLREIHEMMNGSPSTDTPEDPMYDPRVYAPPPPQWNGQHGPTIVPPMNWSPR